MRKLGAMAAVAVLLVTAGCGGGRPSEDEVSKALQKGVTDTKDKSSKLQLKKKSQADCVAKALVKSKLSDDTLRQIVDKGTITSTKTNESRLKNVQDDLTKCSA